ncbi:Cell wall synthesis protein kre9 precursor [Paecilomyces lecythidis]|uniref:Cell wall synthesis protein kre9 n=1 Tax=Paecilomyces lecythidis TaxID=3004212 RepID=A0ABR3WSY6_9EURO
MKLIRTLSLLVALTSAALADVEFLEPDAGATAKGGDTITVRWRDSGKEPKLSQLTRYDLYLCAGGDTADSYEELSHLITEGTFARGNSVSFKIEPEVGDGDENAYFLKMVSKGPDTEIVNYSKRFTLTQMTGTFPSNVRDGLASVSDLGGPGFKVDEEQSTLEREELRKRQAAGEYTIPYQDQLTGLTKYAPAAQQPGTTITAKSRKRQFPTSAYDVATTFLPEPTVETTLTASATFSTSSIENTASPAPQPDSDLKRFLRRWQDE